jgi:hypothetical protein
MFGEIFVYFRAVASAKRRRAAARQQLAFGPESGTVRFLRIGSIGGLDFNVRCQALVTGLPVFTGIDTTFYPAYGFRFLAYAHGFNLLVSIILTLAFVP